MPFHLRLDEQAAKALMSYSVPLRRHVAAELRRLAQDPKSLSRPASFPHPLDGQLFDTKFVENNIEHFITVMFHFHADETHLDIAWITHRQRPDPGLNIEDV